MALVAVIWSVALLSVVAASFLSAGGISYGLAHNQVEAARAEVLAEAAINRAVLALLDPRPDKRWRTDGTAQDFEFDGAHMRVRIQDELGRIDLNHADGSLLAGLFRSAGLDAEAADRLVDKILDWRTSGPAKRLNGAKDEDYRAAGRAYLPRNGPFQSVDELKLIMSMTPSLFERVEPALTVYSGHQLVDPQVASREVLSALPSMNADRIAALVTARAEGSTPMPASVTDWTNSSNGRAFGIRAEIGTANGVSAREAAIRLTGDPARAFWRLSWKGR